MAAEPMIAQVVPVPPRIPMVEDDSVVAVEARNRNLTESSPDAILVHAFGEVLYVNPACLKLLGFARAQEIVGRSIHSIADPRDHDRLRARLAQLAAGVHQPFAELRLVRQDGVTVYVDAAATPIQYDGRAAVQVVARDATERRQRERELRVSEARFRSLTELSSDWYWEQDAELRFVVTGGSQDARGGISATQHNALRRWELPGTEALTGSWDDHKAVLAARLPFRDFMLRRTAPDGGLHYVKVSGEPIFDEAGAFRGYRGVAKDVTASHEAVLALQESERRLSALFSNLPGMAYRCRNDANWSSEFVSDGARALTGYAPEEFTSGRITFGQLMHPGDRQRAWDTAQQGLHSRMPFILEYRLRTADGGEKRVWERGAGVYAQDGSIVALEGFVEDITERRRAEAAVRESEERFRNLSGLSSDWYWEQDTEFRFTHTSVDQGSPVFGDPMKPIGKARWELPLTPLSCTWDVHRETLQAHRTFRDFEYSYAGANGEPRYVSASGYPVIDPAGAFRGYRGIAKEITERKYADGRLRMHAQRQEAIAQFGQFAIGRRSVEELYTEAARALRCEGVDAVSLLEMFTERNDYLVRATQGEGPHESLGQKGTMSPDSVWRDILRDNAPRVAGREYLASRPLDRPWRAWLHGMGSAVYAPVRDDENPIAMLCIFAVREQAFGPEDVRFAEAVGHVLSAALQRQKAEERLAHLAQFDALTGLPNRALLHDRLAHSLVQARRRHNHVGVLFVDLDRFKQINDTLGHHQGDALIWQVGQRLLACVRAGDTVGRISGDEFAVVLADMAHPDDAALVAQKVLEALARSFDLGGNEAYITASIGIAAFPGDGDDAETLLKNADMAMYRAKELARNSYHFFTAEMNERTLAKAALNTDLRRALERGEFALHYQPKVDLASGKLHGMEALIRWNHPVRGLVSPAEFIPALEDSGLIIPVGEWVVEEACRQLRRWQAAGCMPVPVAVNLSPKQFRRRDLDAVIGDALSRSGVSAEFLELEITESCLMENPADAVRVMRNLRAAGLRISIDDFGTGYSSLSYLTRLPLSALKIDGSFVRDVDSSAESASIVRAIIDMAQNLHLTVIAEGVETEQQAAFLRRHGCEQAQGYYFGRPVAPEQIAPRLARP